EQVASGSVAGELGQFGIRSPWAKQGVGVALGTEYRTEALSYSPDSNVATGNLGGLGGKSPAVAGGFQVIEAFGELQLPIL
ncbi:hypothetical protein ABTM90_20495, partial [Acinetobacter baumannii]